VNIEVVASDPQPAFVEWLLRSLPDWFGIESAIVDYIDAARRLPTLIARLPGGPPTGVLLYERHFPESVEVHLIAVDPACHRRGVGRALVSRLESLLRDDGAGVMSVKTLGPSHPDEGYRKTRSFYVGCGFVPVEEMVGLWPGNPCLLMVKPL
jgi:GNAT superfamily N-acetyltransferase